jgi:hypothetical protein
MAAVVKAICHRGKRRRISGFVPKVGMALQAVPDCLADGRGNVLRPEQSRNKWDGSESHPYLDDELLHGRFFK